MHARITDRVRSVNGGIFGYSFDGNYCYDDDYHFITLPFLPCVQSSREERYKLYEDIMVKAIRYDYLKQAQETHLGINGVGNAWYQDYNPLQTHTTIHDIFIRRMTKYSGLIRGFSFIGRLDEVYNNPHRPFVARDLDIGVAARLSSTD